MQYFTIFQDKLHSVNIKEDQSFLKDELEARKSLKVFFLKPNL